MSGLKDARKEASDWTLLRSGDLRALAEALDVTRQSFWNWHGKGLTNDAKLLRRIEAALEIPHLAQTPPARPAERACPGGGDLRGGDHPHPERSATQPKDALRTRPHAGLAPRRSSFRIGHSARRSVI